MKVYMGHLKVWGVKNIRYVLLILQNSDLHILHFVYENFPASRVLVYYDKGDSQSIPFSCPYSWVFPKVVNSFFPSIYIDFIICSVPFYSFTQLFASRTYVAKIITHINYFVNLPILRPSQRLHTIYHLFFKACILQWPYAKLSTEVVQYLLFS